MSTQPATREVNLSSEVRYEVSASDDVVTLSFQRGGTEVSFSIDQQCASLLAADIQTAVDKSTHETAAEQSEFIFE